MTYWIVFLLVGGLILSAFFSGIETGFFRVTRVRVVLDALSGDLNSRGLLWLINHPSLFVATCLIGNNLANYMVSFAIVMAMSGRDPLAVILAPIVFSPLIFVYGELLPKNLFFQAPNRLLHTAGPLFLLFAVLILPVSVLVWALSKVLQVLVGHSPQQIQLVLARKELQQVIEEGHHAGILQPAQRVLAQGLFALASRPVVDFSTPLGRVLRIRLGMNKADVLRLAKRHRTTAIVVEEPGDKRPLIGYVRVVDLYLDESETVQHARPLLEIQATETHIAALVHMESLSEGLARVVNLQGETIGIVTSRNLSEPLFRGG